MRKPQSVTRNYHQRERSRPKTRSGKSNHSQRSESTHQAIPKYNFDKQHILKYLYLSFCSKKYRFCFLMGDLCVVFSKLKIISQRGSNDCMKNYPIHIMFLFSSSFIMVRYANTSKKKWLLFISENTVRGKTFFSCHPSLFFFLT